MSLRSPSPLERAHAIVRVVESHDIEAVHKLVDLLEDSDRAVRFYAILALRRMCSEDYGYQYYADEHTRAAAVQRWRSALRDGRVIVRPPSDGTAADADEHASAESGADANALRWS